MDTPGDGPAHPRAGLLGFALAFAGMGLTATNFLTAKHGVTGFGPQTFCVLWMAASTAYAVGIVALRGRLRELRVPGGLWKAVLWIGFFNGLGQICGWAGLDYLSPAFASFLWRFNPAFAILLGVFFLGERIRPAELAPMALMVVGGAICVYGEWDLVAVGVVLTVLSTLSGAACMAVAKARVTRVAPEVMIAYRSAVALGMLLVFAFATTGLRFEAADGGHWAATLGGALLGPTLGFLCTFWSFKYWPLSRSSLVITVQPLAVIPLAYLFRDELPGAQKLIGGGVILGGALLLGWLHFRRGRRERAGDAAAAAPTPGAGVAAAEADTDAPAAAPPGEDRPAS
ncbi:MAG: DMT family transporter [Planctomycetota bacterium]